jgi:hypothetical protein
VSTPAGASTLRPRRAVDGVVAAIDVVGTVIMTAAYRTLT